VQAQVLIVDDDATLGQTLAQIMETKGYAVKLVATSDEALAVVKRQVPQVAIIDLRLPGKGDGLSLLRAFQTLPTPPESIVLTGYGTRELARAAIAAGAFCFLEKPCDPEYLLLIVQRAVERREVGQKLARREQLLRQILEANPNCIFVKDAEGRYVLVNRAIAQLYGLSEEQMLGKSDQELAHEGYLKPEEAARFAADDAKVLSTQHPKYILEEPFTGRDGVQRWFQVYKVPLDLEGEATQVLGVAVDISESRQARKRETHFRKRLRTLLETVNLLGQTMSVDALARRTVELAKERLGFERISVWLRDPGNPDLLVGTWGTDEQGMLRDERGIQRRIDEQVWRALAREEPEPFLWDHSPLRDMHGRVVGEGTYAQALLRSGDEVIGLITADNLLTGAPFNEEDREVLGLLAATLGPLFARRQMWEALQRTERRLRLALESARAGVFDYDPEQDIIQISERCAYILGYAPRIVPLSGPLQGWLQENTHPDDRKQLRAALEELLNGTATRLDLDVRLRHADGHWVWARIVASVGQTALDGSSRHVVGLIFDVSAQHQAAEERARLLREIRASANLLIGLVETIPEGVAVLSSNGTVLLSNPYARDHLKVLAQRDAEGRIQSLGEQPLVELLKSPVEKGWREIQAGERTFELLSYPLPEAAGEHVLVTRDVTQERKLAKHLRQQDRLAIVGQLAGGIAHEFRNALTVIRGMTDLLLSSLPPDSESYQEALEISTAVDWASAISNQLLIFSRRQAEQPQTLSLNQIIGRMNRWLQRLIGEQIVFETDLDPQLGTIYADEAQVQQVIMNLVLNARDAMRAGGKLFLRSRNVHVDAAQAERHGVSSGVYVMLAVTDTGVGMTDEVKKRLFEPFFTTKGEGRGTGLGLLTVQRIVSDAKGFIEVDSELGKGTTFRIYFPCQERGVPSIAPEQAQGFQPHIPLERKGHETILVVEDEALVRRMTRRILQQQGYTVLEAATPRQALNLCREHQGAIDLMMTDVILPEMKGPDLADQVLRYRPDIRVLFVSGYTDETLNELKTLRLGVHFLQKPYALADLLKKVREILDELS